MIGKSVVRRVWALLLLAGWSLLYGVAPAAAHGPDVLHHVGFDQRLNEQVPLDLVFYDETGRAVRLGDYFSNKPVILVLGYYECPNLCSLVNEGLADSLRSISFNPGKDFEVVSVSIDPGETPQVASQKKVSYLQRYGRAGAEQGWHLLTGEEEQIKQLADAVGFRYVYDPNIDQYAHASGITVLTPQGRIARYFYGITYPATDLRFGLIEASANKIGSVVDQVLLLCYQYDALAGTYSVVIMNVIKLAGLFTVLVLGAFVAVMLRRERRRSLEAQG